MLISAGGLLCRAFLEAYPDHNVNTFISLSGPQAGQFGGKYQYTLHIMVTIMHNQWCMVMQCRGYDSYRISNQQADD